MHFVAVAPAARLQFEHDAVQIRERRHALLPQIGAPRKGRFQQAILDVCGQSFARFLARLVLRQLRRQLLAALGAESQKLRDVLTLLGWVGVSEVDLVIAADAEIRA